MNDYHATFNRPINMDYAYISLHCMCVAAVGVQGHKARSLGKME